MSRHHHKPDKAAIVERDNRRRALAAKLAASCDAAESDPRVELLSWTLLRIDNLKQAILRGANVDPAPWEAIAAQLSALLPAQAQDLRVTYVGTIERCPQCKFERPDQPGPSQIVARQLGEWIDTHCADWSHRALTEAEQSYLRGEFQSMATHFICRDLWARIYEDEVKRKAEEAPAPVKVAEAPATTDVPTPPATPTAPPPPSPPATNVVPIYSGVPYHAIFDEGRRHFYGDNNG